MLGLAILFAFNFIGVGIKMLLNIPIPGNVIGLILFVLCLFLNIIKLEWVEASAQFLLQHMMLFFAPFIVFSVALFPMIREQWFAAVVGFFVSTCVVLLVTGWVTKLLSREGENVS